MSKLHDFRADFRRGRTGAGLRANQKTSAYAASVFDADNFMVTADGRLVRRWGTDIRANLPSGQRLESWEYAESANAQFLLMFGDASLTILDMDLTERATLTGCPWTADAIWFLSIASVTNTLIITDARFRTQILTFDVAAGTFSLADFDYARADDDTRAYAPFFAFDKDVELTPSIFTSAGQAEGYGSHIVTAIGGNAADFDLDLGTGKMLADADLFEAGHVGTRMCLGTGEFEITAVVGPRQAQVKVLRDMAVKLETNPFYIRRNSTTVEITAEAHGLSVGDEVFFFGLSGEATDYAQNVLTSAPLYAIDPTSVPFPVSGTAATYTVSRIVDDNFFEVQAEAPSNTDPGLYGGPDVYMIPVGGIGGVTEPAFSDVRGWPQACAIHESRLWLGGTDILPDALWASRPFAVTDFGLGDGSGSDAIAMYGIGEQSRVRHMVSNFDLLIFCDNGEFYCPGSTEQAITQETARALNATRHGAAYTTPRDFDGAVFFLDKSGDNVRELILRNAEQGYYAPPASVVVPDWIRKPKQSCLFPGAGELTTPYLIWTNDEDGALLLLHSSRADEAFGFMRWTLDRGSFVSVATVANRLFAVAERADGYFLIEFDTDTDFITTDFSERFDTGGETNFSCTYRASETLQLISEGMVFSDVEVEADGTFETFDPLKEVVVGDPMPYLVEMNAPMIATGQGAKAGKMQRLISTDVFWDRTTAGQVAGETVLKAQDNPQFEAPTPVDEWRQYYVGLWGREPRLVISGNEPGRVAIRALALNVHVR